MTLDLEELGERVARAHDELGHELGWLLLYTPAHTLSPDTILAFVGLNPGGSHPEPSRVSCEAGNAYRVEGWAPGGGHNRLQTQIGLLYETLAERMGANVDPAALMDSTLAMNFCPFRSGSWETLASPAESIAFSIGLWHQVLAECHPRVMVCMGELAAGRMGEVLRQSGARRVSERSVLVGWGKVTFTMAEWSSEQGNTLLVRLPHLSRFAFLGRPQSQAAVDELVDSVVAALSPT